MGGPLAKKAFRRRNAMHVELAIGDATVRTLDHDPDDIVLLTSDGVHGNLTRPELEQTIGEHLRTGSVEDLPEHLAHAAQVAGDEGTGRRHPDDITCVALTTRSTVHDPS